MKLISIKKNKMNHKMKEVKALKISLGKENEKIVKQQMIEKSKELLLLNQNKKTRIKKIIH